MESNKLIVLMLSLLITKESKESIPELMLWFHDSWISYLINWTEPKNTSHCIRLNRYSIFDSALMGQNNWCDTKPVASITDKLAIDCNRINLTGWNDTSTSDLEHPVRKVKKEPSLQISINSVAWVGGSGTQLNTLKNPHQNPHENRHEPKFEKETCTNFLFHEFFSIRFWELFRDNFREDSKVYLIESLVSFAR